MAILVLLKNSQIKQKFGIKTHKKTHLTQMHFLFHQYGKKLQCEMHIKSQLQDVQAAYFWNSDGDLQIKPIKFSLQSGTRNLVVATNNW